MASLTSRPRNSSIRRAFSLEPEYTFKHALTQEVAYSSLFQERRSALPRPDRRSPEGLTPRAAHGGGRTAGAPRLPRGATGQGPRIQPPSRGKATGAVGLPRGHRVLRQALATLPICRSTRDTAAGHRSPARPAKALHPLENSARLFDLLHAAEALAKCPDHLAGPADSPSFCPIPTR